MSLWPRKPNDDSGLHITPIYSGSNPPKQPRTYFALLCWCCNQDRTFEPAVVEGVVEPREWPSDDPTLYRLESPCPHCGETYSTAVEVPELY